MADNDLLGAVVEGVVTVSGDLTFTLLGNPDPTDVANHRIESLMADANGQVFVARDLHRQKSRHRNAQLLQL